MYTRHALSAAFPSMLESQFDSLVDDVCKNGLNEPIVLFEGQILDGWHRWSACQKADVVPFFKTYEGIDPIGFVKSKNLHRRHLSESQRAMSIVACNEWRKEVPHGTVDVVPIGTLDQMAEEAEVGRRTIARAKLAYDAGRTEEVMEGKVTLGRVEKELLGTPKRATIEVSISAIESYKKQLDDLKNEITALKDRNEELQLMAEELVAENELMQKILEEDERFPAALAEIKKLNDRIRIYKEQMVGLQNQANEAIRLAKKATKQNARPSE